ncbi:MULTISPECIES: hypothetical protein [Clostridium]|uniref:DUF7210 domain-containing protein n=1 Tax=Clostridium novyi B str. ATCC 27606 TaxID=1443123 RepID=A0AA40IRV0_CLONO|nr:MULTISPECIES: hypothetical protein [Clostridium]KEI08161.1 hypothetical protein Z958_p0041 [Clostridium novyi B str. NCTC 9691]KEI11500.1 hypothetical protein Z959_p0066 [Clostridium novyi B str. ATCC 27606]KLU74269.1 hypothetical protein CBC3_p0270 [Clostridium botulinum V891]
MASKKTIQAKALVNLKYDKSCFNIGDELKVRVDDTTEMVERGYIELLEEVYNVDEDERDEVEEGE